MDANQLILFRVFQGAGAALLAPQSLTVLTSVFPPERRGAAFGILSSVAGLAVVVGPTVAAAFDRLYYLEESCHRQILAMSAQRPLRKVEAAVAQGLAEQVPLFDAYADKHLAAIKRVLNREQPEYAS